MRLIADIHTHTLASGHAYGTMSEMAYSASKRGLHILGITEHAPGIPGTVDPFYYMNFEVVPRTLFGVTLIHGSEINVLNDGTLSLEQTYIDKLDYGIVGIHSQCYTDQGKIKNTQNLIKCMENPKIKFISHPDDDHNPLDYELLVTAAKKHQVALEINNSSLLKQDRRLNCVENYRKMLKLCKEYCVPIVISSDAHFPDAVGKFDQAINLLNMENFPEELVLNMEDKRLMSFLSYLL